MRKMACRFAAFVAVLIVSMLCSGAALSYNTPGHMQSVRLIVEESLGSAPISAPEKNLVAACAQLPDMSEELDAAKAYVSAFSESKWDWARWGATDKLGNAKLQQMFAVQHLVHALTGGDPVAVRAIAIASLKSLAERASSPQIAAADHVEALCALGFAFHFWGDSIAHTEVPWNNDDDATLRAKPPKMYPTGRGHGFSDGHLPDDILCAFYTKPFRYAGTSCNQNWSNEPHRRLLLWAGYWSGTANLLYGTAKLESYFGIVPPAPPYTEQDVRGLLASIRTLGDGKLRGLDDISPDTVDPKVGDKIKTYLLALHQGDPAGTLDDLRDSSAMAFQAELNGLDKLGIMEPENPCSNVLRLILGMNGVLALSGGQAMPTCESIWNRYSTTVREKFKNCIDHTEQAPPGCEGVSPIDPDWKQIYQQDSGSSAPIDCYAALVPKIRPAACPFKN